MKTLELHQSAVNAVKQKYHVLYSSDCRDFVNDYNLLDVELKKIKKEKFSPNDRVMLVHMDTDYYDPLLPCGLLPINLVRLFKENDIPLYLLLFVTNHFGIKKEFDTLLKDQHANDRPTVVETLLSVGMISEKGYSTTSEISADLVEMPGLTMMGRQRSHRVALCNFITNNQLLNYIALTTNFTK